MQKGAAPIFSTSTYDTSQIKNISPPPAYSAINIPNEKQVLQNDDEIGWRLECCKFLLLKETDCSKKAVQNFVCCIVLVISLIVFFILYLTSTDDFY